MNKKAITLILTFLTCVLSAKSQSDGFQIKNGWGVSLYSDFTVKEYYEGVIGITAQAPFEQLWVSKMYSFGANASYTIFPFKKCSGLKFPFFTRFVLGGEYNKYGDNESFIFNAEALLGYTFKIKKIGIEIFTGPKGKFAPYTRSYKTKDKLNKSKTIKMYSGGLYWTAGVGLRSQHVGFSVSYNQGLTKDFEHLWSPTNKKEYFFNIALFNTMTIGLQYYF